MKLKAEKSKYNSQTIGFCALEILYLFYYSYRYIFKFNSTGTSATYQNTPASIQILKYLLVFAVIFYLAVKNGFFINIARRNLFLFIGSILLITHEAFLIIADHSEASFKLIIGILPIIFFLGDKKDFDITLAEKIFDVFFWFTLIYEAIQIICYYTIGRLPALAYPTGRISDVRFGGAWDDPNGYAILLSFYIPYIFLRYRGRKRMILELCCMMMEILCWSGTGIICAVISGCIVFLLVNRDQNARQLFWLFIFIVFINVFVISFVNTSFVYKVVSYFLHAKQGSVQQHLAGWNLKKINLASVLGLSIDQRSTEVGYLVLFFSGGIFDLMIFVIMMVTVVRRLIIQLRHGPDSHNALIAGSLAYTIAIMIGSFNLPLFYSFSNLGILSLVFCLAARSNLESS